MRIDTRITRRAGRSVLLAAGLLAQATLIQAQPVPSDSVLHGFLPSTEYDVVIDKKTVASAEVYQNTSIPAFLVVTASLSSPVLLSPRAGKVETVNLMKVSKQKDGSVDLLADAVLAPAGKFTFKGENVVFSLDKKEVVLQIRPPVLGTQKNAELKTKLPEYARGAKGYTPNAAAIASLKKSSVPAVVKIYFGSWCPHCREHVPLLLRVEDDTQNPKIQFQYYGLDHEFADPEAKRLGIKSVPTGIVYVSGKEVGRLVGNAWTNPEVLLSKILASPTATASAKPVGK